LKGFVKVSLQSGETKNRFDWIFTPESLAFYDIDMK